MPALTIDAARAALQRSLRQDFGLALDLLDPVRVEGLLRRAPDVGAIQHPNLKPALLALASGSRGEHVPAAVLPYLPSLLQEAVRRRLRGTLRIWMVGAATGSGPQDLGDLLRLCKGLGQDCLIFATDPDPLGLTRLELRGSPAVELVLQSGCPSSSPRPEVLFDLILCRDLLRFLHDSRIDDVYNTLVERIDGGGALVVHGADPLPPAACDLRSSWRGGARVYHRGTSSAQQALAEQQRRVSDLMAQGAGEAAVGLALRLATEAPDDVAVRILAARCCLHLGLLGEGLLHARAARQRDPTAVMPTLLELELARAMGDVTTVQAARAQAETLLAARLPSALLADGEGLTAASMRQRLAG